MNKMKNKLTCIFSPLGVVIAAACGTSFAQVAAVPPDAGSVIQQLKPVLQAPEESKFVIEFDGDASKALPPGGPTAELKQIKLTGVMVFSEALLLDILGPVTGKAYDLAGFRKLADQISQYYRSHGYPFARAYIPAQDLKDGVLNIHVLEGRYGNVQVKTKDAAVQDFMQDYLKTIKPGEPIASDKLERAILIMNDLPGVKAVPAISPGEATGAGNLTVLVSEMPANSGDITVDNQGSRYTGYNRVNAGYKHAHLFTLGDEIDLRGLVSDETMYFGRLGYSLPILPNGLRGNVSYSRTSYVLAKDFAPLDALGISEQYAVGLTYPLIRSQITNLTLGAAVQRKELVDDFRAANSKNSKSSNALPLTLNFDTRDQFLAGGLTYGALSYTVGSMDNPQDFANTVGEFQKVNLDFARLQNLNSNFSVFVKYSAQFSQKNLDSSEDFFLGGGNGVRAYPQGEAAGDNGYLAQIELRYHHGAYAPYAFYDTGWASVYASPTADLVAETRKLGGAGVGVRYNRGNWNADISAAWRKEGGNPTSDLFRDPTPRILFSMGYRF